MNRPKLKFEHLIYAAAFLLALGIRLAGAATQPLTNSEADLALQALALSRGQEVVPGPHPAYLVLTTVMMFLFGAGDWVARFWPAVLGSLLVLLPLLFRNRLGKLPAVLLAFFLALDPGLLAVSRQAGSASLALFFTLLALGLWLKQKTTLAGVAAGMAAISGPQVWPGLLALAAAAWLTRGRELDHAHSTGDLPRLEDGAESGEAEPAPARVRILDQWQRPLIFALAAMFFAGTLFFILPAGLSAMADSIPAYLRGWVAGGANGSAGTPAGMPVSLLLIALLLYELFPFFFGIWGALQSLLRRSITGSGSQAAQPVDRFLLVWFLIALVLVLVYPARQAADLGWAILPLWGLAARQLARLANVPDYDRVPVLGHMALTAVILGYIAMALVLGVNGTPENTWEYQVRIGGAALMLLASTGLIAWGWSPMVSLRGFSWGVGILLFLFMVSAGWNSVGLSGRGEELWNSGPRIRDGDLLSVTIQDLTVLNRSIPDGPDMVIVGESSSSLRWLLRDVKRLQFASQLPSDTSPALVITTNQPELALASTYRGQDLVLGESVRWQQLGLAEWLRWWMLRSTPSQAVQQDWGILWARSDLFADGLEGTSSIPAPGKSLLP